MTEKLGTIVIVEDEPDVLELLRDVLESEGFAVIGAASPDLVPRLVGAIHPDLFLIDLMLPHMSGIELAQQLRQTSFTETPMIAMSASRLMLEIATKAKIFQGTLPKPFDLSSVLEYVERYTMHSTANG